MRWLLVMVAACGDHAATPDAAIDAAPPAQLVAQYAMDNDPNIEGMIDLGGHHLDGNCSINQCPTLVAGHIGMAYHFDGNAQHVRVPDNGMFTLRHGFTVALWVSHDIARDDTLIAKPLQNAGESWQIDVAGGAARFCTTHAGATSCLTGATVSVAQWTFVAAVWTGARKSLYVDGAAMTDPADELTDFDATLMSIGADIENGTLATPLQGAIDQLRIYDGAVGPTDLATLAQEM